MKTASVSLNAERGDFSSLLERMAAISQ